MKSAFFTSLLFTLTSAFAGLTPEEIAKREAAEQLIPVRPGDPAKGVPFWTARAQVARRPIGFDFKPVDGAVRYEYLVIAADHARYTFTTNSPSAPLTPVWSKLPAGPVTVFVEGLDKDGRTCGRAGFKRFAKSANYTGDYPKAKRPYAVAARKVYEYMISIPAVTAIADTGKPDPNYGLNSYPTKMRVGTILAMLAYARLAPEKRDRAFAIACAEADYLIATRLPKGSPLEYFTLTYADGEGVKEKAAEFRGQSMTQYPADAGFALVALYEATGKAKYLDAAKDIAGTFLRRQLPNGSWYLREWLKTGEKVCENYLVPNAVIEFLLALNRVTKDARYLEAADRAFAYIEEGPMKSFNWEGQFEDVAASKPYRNHTIHMSMETALYLLKRFPGDKARLAEAREILRFAEDQFVFWEAPRWDWLPPSEERDSLRFAYYPSAFEQYACYTPIDSSAARAIELYLALYRAEGNELDLLKARTLADSIVNMQDDDGRIPTWWERETFRNREADWLNCMAAAAAALQEVAVSHSSFDTKASKLLYSDK